LETAIQEQDLQVRDRKKAEVYILLATIFEDTNPPRISDALNNWRLLLSLPFASAESKSLAQSHIDELTGEGPTRTPTLSPTPSVSPQPTATATPTP
jgi:hypothetical protein